MYMHISLYVFVQVRVHDRGIKDRDHTISGNYLNGADVALLIYSVDDPYTFDEIKVSLQECSRYGPTGMHHALIGNKIDLENKIDHEFLEEFVGQLQLDSYLVSSRTGENVNEMFEDVVKKAGARLHKQGDTPKKPRIQPSNCSKQI